MKKVENKDSAQPVTTEPAAVAPKPGELKELFVKYEQANAAVAKADAAYTAAMSARSAVVEKFAAFGKAFDAPNGDRLKIMCRTNKETQAKAYYFQGPGKAEALKIE